MMMIPDADIFLYYIDHLGTDEAVTQNEDGTYSIFIDPQLSPEARQEKYEHALEHIKKLDFERQSVQEIEAHAHHIQSTPDNEKSTTNIEKIVQTRKRRRKSTKKQWRKVNERVEFIKRYDPEYFFRQAEYNKLYGGL